MLGPLTEREKLFFDGTLNKQEDMGFVEGLLLVLENDLAQGHVPTPDQAYAWAEHLTMELHPPRIEAERGTHGKANQDDARERLLARLMDLGADPWRVIPRKGNAFHNGPPGSDNYRSRLLGSHLAGTWLAYGYFNAVRRAMDLPHEPNQYLATGPQRSFEERDQTMIQQAAMRDQVNLLKRMLTAGAPVDGVLHHAQSVEAVELLLEYGADLDNGNVVAHWLAKHDAKTTRALIRASEEHMTPQARLGQALTGKSWGPVNDAMEAWSEWREARLPLGDAELPLGMHTLASSTRKQSHRVQHALRILAKQPPTDQEAFPGVSEKSLARLMLYALAHPDKIDCTSSTKEDLSLTEKLLAKVMALGGDAKTLQDDALRFVHSARPVLDTTCAQRIGQVALAQNLLLPNETTRTPLTFSQRSMQDMITLGLAGRCTWQSASTYRGDDGAFSKLFFATPQELSNHGYGGAGSNNPRRTWFPKMLSQHPEHAQALGATAVYLLGAGLSRKMHSTHEDPWGVLCQQLDAAMEQGALDGLPQADGVKLSQIAQSNSCSAGAISLGARLQSLLQQMTLDASTPEAKTVAARRRF